MTADGGPETARVDDVAHGGGMTPTGLPSDPTEYARLEKKLVRKIDWRLMPVLVVMIVLK